MNPFIPSSIVVRIFGYVVEEFFQIKTAEEKEAPKVSFS
jgi:hypothetical protein